MSLLGFIVIIGTVVILGGGTFLWIWLASRPKVQKWRANCYQLTKGKRRYKSGVELNDLIPYCKDTLIRQIKGKGQSIYKLGRLKLTTNAPTADDISVWGKDKEVDVLIDGSTATILNRGYDSITGKEIFIPMPRERIELITSEIILQQDRLKDKKSTLEKALGYIVTGMWILGMVGITYLIMDATVKTTENLNNADELHEKNLVVFSENFREGAALIAKSFGERLEEKNDNLGLKNPNINKSAPPSIE